MLKLLKYTLLVCATSSLAFSDNLLSNPGFETGDFTDWTLTGNTDFAGVSSSFDGFSPLAGTYFAFLGPVGSDGFISQTVATTPGTDYTISWYLGSDGSIPNDFSVTFDGIQVFSAANLASTAGQYIHYSVSAPTADAFTTVTFGFRNDPGYLALDNTSVSTVPEPSGIFLLGAGWACLAALRGLRHTGSQSNPARG